MGVYELFPDYANATTFTDATGRTLGTEIDVASGVWATHIVFRRATATGHLPTHVSIWRVTGQVELAPTVVAYAGNPASGRVAVPLLEPVYLAPGDYVSAGRYAGSGTLGMPGWSAYWTTGPGASGHTAGPLTAPSSAASVGGQGRTITGATRAYPSTGSASGAQYGFSLVVTDDPPDGVNDSPSPCAASTTGWLAAGSTGATQGQITGLTGLERTTGYRVTNGAGAGNQLIYSPPAIKPADIGGLIPTTCMTVRSSTAATVVPYVVWTDAAGTQTTTSAGAGVAVAANVPTRIDPPRTAAPAGTRGYRLCAYIVSAPASNQLVVTLVRLQLGAAAITPFPYADGDMPGWVWDGATGTSTSQRADDTVPVWATPTDTAAVGSSLTTMLYRSTAQTQGTDNTYGTTSAITTVAAPGGRPGVALPISVTSTQKRVETFPHNDLTFVGGDGPWWFSFAFYLPAGFPMGAADWQVIEQLKQASGTGSPPIAFEALGGQLLMTGGYGIDAGNVNRLKYAQVLAASLQTSRWYSLVYKVSQFSTAESTTVVDVWLDGTQVLTSFTVPPPTVIPDTTGNGTGVGTTVTYRKQGLYHDPALGAATIYTAGAALGRSFVAVDPARVQTLQAAVGLVSGSQAAIATPWLDARAAATLVSGSTAGPLATQLIAQAAVTLVSGSRAEPTVYAERPAATTLVSGSTVAAAGIRTDTAGALALSSGSTLTAALLVPGATSLVSGSTVTLDGSVQRTLATELASGSMVYAAGDRLDAVGALLVSGSRADIAALVDRPAVTELVSGSRLEPDGRRVALAAVELTSGAVLDVAAATVRAIAVSLASGTVLEVAGFSERAAAVDLRSGSSFGAVAYGQDVLLSGSTLEVVGPSLTALAAASAVSGSRVVPGAAVAWAATALTSGSRLDVTGFAERAAAVDLRSGSRLATDALGPQSFLAVGLVSGSVAGAEGAVGRPVGVVTLVTGSMIYVDATVFTPIFVAPRGPVLPQVPVPRHRLLVADTITGKIVHEFPYTALSWNTPLNKIPQCSATLPVGGVLDQLAAGGGNPRALLRAFLTGPYRFSLVVAFGGVAMMGGPMLPVDDLDDQAIKVDGRGIERMLEKRRLVKRTTGLGAWTDPRRDITLSDSTVRYATVAAVGNAIAPYNDRPGRLLPIGCSNTPPKPGDQNFAWASHERVSAWKALSDLVERDDGPDVRFEPELYEGSDGIYVRWDMQIGDPTFDVGGGTPGLDGPLPWTWDDTTSKITRSVDALGLTTAQFSAGGGQDRAKAIGFAESLDLITLGFPELEEDDANADNDADEGTAQRRAQAMLDAHSRPTDTWSVATKALGRPQLGTYRRGDLAQLDVRRKLLIEPGTFRRRITDIACSDGDIVTVSCDNEEGLVSS